MAKETKMAKTKEEKMTRETKMTIEKIREQREHLQAQLNQLIALERAEIERRPREAANALIAALTQANITAWLYEPEDSHLCVRVYNKKRTPVSVRRRSGVVIKRPDGSVVGQYSSAAEAVRSMGIPTPTSQFSAPALLRRRGFIVENSDSVFTESELQAQMEAEEAFEEAVEEAAEAAEAAS